MPGTHMIGIRVDPRGVHSGKGKDLDLCPELNSSHPMFIIGPCIIVIVEE